MALLLKIDPGNPDESKIAEAVRILRNGGVIAFPTETLYGLGADALNQSAVEKIFLIKGREFQKPLPVIIADRKYLLPLVEEIPADAEILIRQFWPGPLTMIFRAAPSLSHRLTGGTGKIGIRVSDNRIARMIADGLSGPLTSTSANLAGGEECASAEEAIRALGDLPDLFIDGGPTPGGKGSTILDVTISPPQILREGAIAESLIRSALREGGRRLPGSP